MLGPTFVESPFNYENKGTEIFNYGKWLKEALEASGEHEVNSVPSWDFYSMQPGDYEQILDQYDVVIFSDVESKLFQLAPSFFDRSKFGKEPLVFPDTKWHIGEPDLVITMSKAAKLPADGYVPYKYAFLPHKFTEDTWIEKIEILPGNMQAVHHCNAAAIVNGNTRDPHFITGFVPGGDPMVLDPNQAFRIPKNSVIILQLHYITTGEETTDKTSVGIVYAKDRIEKELHHFRVNDSKFAIPPGAPHHPVVARRTLDCNAIGIGMFAHMHLRGKDMTFIAKYPDETDKIGRASCRERG